MKTRTARLSEIITEMDSGGRPKGGAAASGVLSLGGEHIGLDGSFLLDDKKFVPEDYFSAMRRGRIQRNDILIVKDGATTGKVALADGRLPLPAAVNEHVFRVAVDTSVADPQYVFYHLLGPVGNSQILRDFRGATVGGISQDFPDEVSLPLPSLPEQCRIAAMLEQADRLRRTRRYALELSNAFLPAAFLEMFGDLRENPHAFSVQELGELCDVRDGTHDSPAFHHHGIPLVTSKNLVNGVVDLTEVDLISDSDYEKINKRSKVDKGDILMPMIGTIGNPVLVENDPYYAIKNVALIKFTADSPSALYIRELLKSDYFDHLTAGNSRGGTQKFVALGDIRAFRIPVPPLVLQQRFADLVRGHERLRAAQREALRQAEHLFQSLLHRAFEEG